MVITPACHAGGRGFKSRPSRHLLSARLAFVKRAFFFLGVVVRRWAIVPLLLLVAGIAYAARPTKRLSDEDRGKLLYERHCVQCHGPTAAGDGLAASALVKAVPNLRDGKLSTDMDANQAVVLNGRGVMPGFQASFDEYDARRVLRWMKKLADGPVVPESEAKTPLVGDEKADTDEPSPEKLPPANP